MTLVIQQVVDGLAIGTTYALVAIGFTLVFGVMKLLNMAQATLVLVAAYSGVVLLGAGVENVALLLGAAIGVSIVVALVVDFLALRPFVRILDVSRSSDADHLAPFIATIGIVIAAQHAVLEAFGGRGLGFRVSSSSAYEVGGVYVTPTQVLALGCAAVMMVMLESFLRRSKRGLWLRATAQNPGAAAALGVNTKRVLTLVTVLAAILGGLGGVLVAAMDQIVTPFMDLTYGLKGLIAMIVGGMNSIRGAVVVALFMGISESLTVAYIGSGIRDLVPFAILVAVMIIRPQGLFSSAAARPA